MTPPLVGRDLSVLEQEQHDSCSTQIDEDSSERGDGQPVAVIDISFRFPQEATSSEAFWRMLVEGRSEIPRDRFNIEAFHHPDSSRHDSVCDNIFLF